MVKRDKNAREKGSENKKKRSKLQKTRVEEYFLFGKVKQDHTLCKVRMTLYRRRKKNHIYSSSSEVSVSSEDDVTL